MKEHKVGDIYVGAHSTEEVIFVGFDEGWQCNLPVKLFTYHTGGMDMHRQTGSQFREHVAEAEKILAKRGLVRDLTDPDSIGSTGVYMSVKKVEG